MKRAKFSKTAEHLAEGMPIEDVFVWSGWIVVRAESLGDLTLIALKDGRGRVFCSGCGQVKSIVVVDLSKPVLHDYKTTCPRKASAKFAEGEIDAES